MRTLCEEIKIEIPTLMSLTEEAHKQIKNQSMKMRLTKFLNLLFQIIPTEQTNTTQ